MATALAKTFQLLAKSSNPHSPELLVAALNVDNPNVQQAAIKAITLRDFAVGQVAVISRWPSMAEDVKAKTAQAVDQLRIGIKQCLRHGDRDQTLAALSLVELTKNYPSIGFLLDAHKRDESEISSRAADCVYEFCNSLYFHIHPKEAVSPSEDRVYDLNGTRDFVLEALREALDNIDSLPDPGRVIESFLMLADVDSATTRQVLMNPKALSDIVEQLVRGTHPGISRFLLNSLALPHPPQFVIGAVEARADAEFVQRLLAWLPRTMSPHQQANLKNLKSMPWLVKYRQLTEMIAAEQQPELVRFVQVCGLKGFRKNAIFKWLLQNGSPEGRGAAAEAVSGVDDVTTQAIVEDGLESQDENVQAWATTQLRAQGIPDALVKLVDRLDSPLESVRDAARGELKGFDVERMLGIFKQLDPAVCRNAGDLIQKINPNCVDELVAQLNCSIHQKRIRAAHGALALGLHTHVVPELLAMVCDAEQSVRKTAAEILGHVATSESFTALELLTSDSSRFVRETAVASLELLRHGIPELQTS